MNLASCAPELSMDWSRAAWDEFNPGVNGSLGYMHKLSIARKIRELFTTSESSMKLKMTE